MNQTEVWIVACADLHAAYGLLADVGSATRLARTLTDQTECVFLPVKLMVLGSQDVKELKTSEGLKTTETPEREDWKRGYL